MCVFNFLWQQSVFEVSEKFLINKSYLPISLSCQEGRISGCAAMVLSHLPLPFFLLFLLFPCTSPSRTCIHGVALPHGPLPAVAAAGPILQDRPFVVVWNMPTARCQKRHDIHLDLGDFDIVENRKQRFQGQVIDLSGTVSTMGCDALLSPVQSENIFDVFILQRIFRLMCTKISHVIIYTNIF